MRGDPKRAQQHATRGLANDKMRFLVFPLNGIYFY
jgi:hypothetical protein